MAIYMIAEYCLTSLGRKQNKLKLSLDTYDAILHTESKLVLEVRSLDEHCSNRRAADDVHFHLHLIL